MDTMGDAVVEVDRRLRVVIHIGLEAECEVFDIRQICQQSIRTGGVVTQRATVSFESHDHSMLTHVGGEGPQPLHGQLTDGVIRIGTGDTTGKDLEHSRTQGGADFHRPLQLGGEGLGRGVLMMKLRIGADSDHLHFQSLHPGLHSFYLLIGQIRNVILPDFKLLKPSQLDRLEQINEGPTEFLVRRPTIGFKHDGIEQQFHGRAFFDRFGGMGLY